jgi:hypothetical protein
MRRLILLLLLCGVGTARLAAQVSFPNPVNQGSTLPATCTPGGLVPAWFLLTSAGPAAVPYYCSALHTWTAGGGSSGGSPAGTKITDPQCWASATTFGVCANEIITGTYTGAAFSTGGTPPALTPGTGGAVGYSEGTVPIVGAAAGVDVIYADSTQHGFLASLDGGSYLPLIQGPASATSGHIVSWNSTNGGLVADGGVLGTAASVSSTCSGTDLTGTLPGCTIVNAAVTAAKMINSGVFTGDAVSTFPAITISNNAITAAKMVNGGAFTGDVTTTFPAVTVSKINGTSVPTNASADQFLGTTGAATGAWASIANCTDTGGNHLNYATATHAFSCGTSSTGSGTVTSVGWTGGIVSIATATTTPAFTIAGTSGGIPYFSGAATWASSGAGTQNDVIAWGGAGNPPVDTSILYTNLAKINTSNNFTAGPQNITLTALGTTQTDGWEFYNTTAAANNAQQISPSAAFEAAGWNTTTPASNTILGYIQMLGVQGTSTGASNTAGVDGLFQIQNKIGANAVKNLMQIGQQFGSSGNGVNTASLWLGNVTATTGNWIIATDGSNTYINNSGGTIDFGTAGSIVAAQRSTGLNVLATGQFGFASSGGASNAPDTALQRDSAGVAAIVNGTQGTTAANYRAIKYSGSIHSGTTFTLSSNGCSANTLVGGASAGSFVSQTSGTCAVTILMGNSLTAPNGFHCSFQDHTTPGDTLSQTGAADTTHCSMTGTTVTGDLISFVAEAY